MDIGAVRALTLDVNFEVHGVDITVARPAPDDTAIESRGIWMTVHTEDAAGGPFTRREGIKAMAFRRDEVPTVPDGTEVLAPENFGEDAVGWRTDGTAQVFVDHVRAFMRRATDLDPA